MSDKVEIPRFNPLKSVRLQTLICFVVWCNRGKGLITKKPDQLIMRYMEIARARNPESLLTPADRLKVRAYFEQHFPSQKQKGDDQDG